MRGYQPPGPDDALSLSLYSISSDGRNDMDLDDGFSGSFGRLSEEQCQCIDNASEAMRSPSSKSNELSEASSSLASSALNDSDDDGEFEYHRCGRIYLFDERS